MLEGQPMHGCLRLTRRELLTTLLGVTVTVTTVTAQKPHGFHVTGTLTTTDTERAEGYFNLGREIMIAVRPESEPQRILSAMVDREVQMSVFVP